MKTTGLALFGAVTLLINSGCQQSDRDAARERAEQLKVKAEAAARQLEHDGKELGAKATEKAREVGASSRSSTANTPEDKVRVGAAELKQEGKEAGARLSQLTQSAKVKYNLSTALGIGAVSKMEIESTGSVVTLRGSVPNADQKSQAERVAQSTSGVTKVVNELRVEP
jgi:hyperosmotically inducible protein